MKKLKHILSLIALLILFIPVLAYANAGTINAIDLQARTIQVNQLSLVLADQMIVYSPNNGLVSQNMLGVGQNIEYLLGSQGAQSVVIQVTILTGFNNAALKNEQGFNLIELMIVVMIVGILAAIAFPAYNDQVISSRRSDGQSALLNMAALMEHYFTENNTYVGANTTALGLTNLSQQGFYQLSITSATTTTYTLTAAPVAGSPQAADTTCGSLTLTNANVKGPNLSPCWE